MDTSIIASFDPMSIHDHWQHIQSFTTPDDSINISHACRIYISYTAILYRAHSICCVEIAYYWNIQRAPPLLYE